MEEVKKDNGTASQNIPRKKATATGEGITSTKTPKKPRAVAKPNRPEADEAARIDKFDQDSANLEDYPLWALGAKGRKCVEAIAKTKLAHPILVATNLLGLMAGCAQEHADACPAQDSAFTRTPLSLYTIGLAKSGEGKSFSMETLSAGIYRYDDVADKEYEKAQKEYKVARAYYVGELKKWKKRHHIAEQNSSPPKEPEHPVDGHFTFEGGKVERLIKELEYNRRSVLIINDYANQILQCCKMAGCRQANDLNQWCKFWSGELVKPLLLGSKDSKRKIRLDDARVSWALNFRPSLLLDLLRKERGHFRLLARILLGYAPVIKNRVCPTDIDIDLSPIYEFHKQSQHLLSTEAPKDEEGNRPLLVLDRDAKGFFSKTFYEIEAENRKKADNGTAAFRGKLLENALKIAGVFTIWEKGVVDGDSLCWIPKTIDADTLERGVTLARWYVHQWESLVCNFHSC